MEVLSPPLWLDINPREYSKPTIVRFRTPIPEFSWGPPIKVLYAVVGTDYGYLHNLRGGVRVWNSRSGAYKAMRKYSPL